MPKKKIKKKPNDYPLFAIRVSEKQKLLIGKLLEEAEKRLNSDRDERLPAIRKNDIVIDLLLTGLPKVKKLN